MTWNIQQMPTMPLKPNLLAKAKELANKGHPDGIRQMAEELKNRGKPEIAAMYEQIANAAESVLADREVIPVDLPGGLTIEDIIQACPEGGSVTGILYARKCVRAYAQLAYGHYINA